MSLKSKSKYWRAKRDYTHMIDKVESPYMPGWYHKIIFWKIKKGDKVEVLKEIYDEKNKQNKILFRRDVKMGASESVFLEKEFVGLFEPIE